MVRARLAASLAALTLFLPLGLCSHAQDTTIAPPPAQQQDQTSAPAAAPLPQSGLPTQPAAAPQDATPARQTPSAQPTAQAPEQPAEAPSAVPAPEAKPKKEKKDHDKILPVEAAHNASLWHDPGDIAGENLYYGAAGEDGQPKPPFVFLDEDMHDSNPKFDVRDAGGETWRVKLGAEAKPEVVSSRLLWAVGYYVNDDYVVHEASVQNLHLHRGSSQVHMDQVVDVRFAHKPDGQKKIATWAWKHNPFYDTREFNGLRVMMAVLNSWDLKDENNAVFRDKKTHQEFFLVSDIGATFGTNGLHATNSVDKGNAHNYVTSKFITSNKDGKVSFGTPAPPTGLVMKSGGLLAPIYFKRHGFDWIGQNIPIGDARWVGSLLGQLSHQQIEDAFRAGNFTPEQTDEYVKVVEERIAELKAL